MAVHIDQQTGEKLDPAFDLKLERQIIRHVPAQMVLIPSKP